MIIDIFVSPSVCLSVYALICEQLEQPFRPKKLLIVGIADIRSLQDIADNLTDKN